MVSSLGEGLGWANLCPKCSTCSSIRFVLPESILNWNRPGGGVGGGLKKKPVVSFPSLCAAIHPHLLACEPKEIQNLTFAWTNTCLIKSHPRTCNVFVFVYFAVCIAFIRKFLVYYTPETRPQLQTSRKKRSWTSQETMALRRCRCRSNDLIHG